MNKDVEILKNHPSVDELQDILERNRDNVTFAYVNAILNFTIPEIYTISTSSNLLEDNSLNTAIQNVFYSSLIGFGNLVNKISTLNRDMKSKELTQLYLDILQKVVDEGLIPQLVSNAKSQGELEEINKLIFKGRVLSIVNEVSVLQHIEIVNEHLSSTKGYATFLAKSLVQLYINESATDKLGISNNRDNKTLESFIHSILKLGKIPFITFFNVFFQEPYWDYFVATFRGMRTFQKKSYVKAFFVEYLPESRLITLSKNLPALCQILQSLFADVLFNDDNDDAIVELIISTCDKNLVQLGAMILNSSSNSILEKRMLKQLLIWSDTAYIKTEPITYQETRTYFLLTMMSYMKLKDSQFVKALLKHKLVLEGVSNRLQSHSNNAKSLAILLADNVCKLNGEKQIFESANINNPYSNLLERNMPPIDTHISFAVAWSIIRGENQVEEQNTLIEVDNSTSTTEAPTNSAALASQEVDDLENLPQKPKIPNPIYIKDLLTYLTKDTKNPNAYNFRRKALVYGPYLLKQKSQRGNEVEFFAEDLITQLIALDNYFNDSDFDDLKLQNMIAVIVTTPKVTFHLFNLLLNGDYSLQQRITILSAAGLAARELRGFKDDIEDVRKSAAVNTNSGSSTITNTVTNITTKTVAKMLPPQLHEKYMQLETLTNSATEQTKIPQLHKIIATNFYFPLLNVWYEAGTIDIGHYLPIFISHYIKTLLIFIHCAYPSTTQLNDMCKEFLTLSCTVIKNLNIDEIQVVQSVILGILLVFDVLDSLYIVQNYTDDLGLISQWLQSSWEMINDEDVKSVAAKLLLTILDMAKKYERTMLYQDGFY